MCELGFALPFVLATTTERITSDHVAQREQFISNPAAKLPYREQQAGNASTPLLMIFIIWTIFWAAGIGYGCFKGCT